MTKRETISSLLAGNIPERMGLNESFWPHIVNNSWGEQGISADTDFISRFNPDQRSCSRFSAPGPRSDLEKEYKKVMAGDEFVTYSSLFIFEELRRILGDLPIILHTCGDFRPHLESIVESGADCIQAMEAKTGMDVVKLAEVYKDKLCFMGNINIMTLETGDKDKIREECLNKLKGMKDLRAPYVFMSDHSIPPTVSVESYEYMLELDRENCSYGV